MITNFLFQVGNLPLQKGAMLLQGVDDWLSRTARRRAVVFLLAHGFDIGQVAHYRLQGVLFRSKRYPDFRLLRLTEQGNQPSIGLVGLWLDPATGSKCFDPRRVDHTDGIPGLVQKVRNRFSESSM